ncbi:cobalamin B12-binding protein [Qipengyuania sp. 6B39]|uniref:cobalamin B12-binding domain-containing protein n=1 Tax=Qipengyuania proteolytica TaxID=2867239 RepID=UPI001C8AC16E|nr:B12-binding domain-containing protein [Qipengyuania proteolytica]MBX7497094.1 cobalamin B12-binding protein [Qipengyuania proteolytica]
MAKDYTDGVSALRTDTAFNAAHATRHSSTHVSLGGLVEGEIIPRLLMAHRDDCPRAAMCAPNGGAPGCAIDCQEAARFAVLPLRLEADELLAEVETFLERGVPVQTILVDLLAPSARRLGELWEDDACDFVEVTMGLWRLQEVMRVVALRSPPVTRAVETVPTALFAPMPGDQHSFGALMVEEIFARAGWQSEVLFEPKRQELLAILGERAFDLAGLTVTNDCPSGLIADLVSAIRSVSRNPAIRIIIGGRAINANPGLASQVGADGTASDACSALALAERMMADTRPLVGQV